MWHDAQERFPEKSTPLSPEWQKWPNYGLLRIILNRVKVAKSIVVIIFFMTVGACLPHKKKIMIQPASMILSDWFTWLSLRLLYSVWLLGKFVKNLSPTQTVKPYHHHLFRFLSWRLYKKDTEKTKRANESSNASVLPSKRSSSAIEGPYDSCHECCI